jgi:hypothetical protein
VVAGDGGPDFWDDIPPNQRFVPQSPLNPVDPDVEDECLADCADDCEGCDCGCHALQVAQKGFRHVRRIIRDQEVGAAASEVREQFDKARPRGIDQLLEFLKKANLERLVDAVVEAGCRDEEATEDVVVDNVEAKAVARLRRKEEQEAAAVAEAERAHEESESAAARLQAVQDRRRLDERTSAAPTPPWSTQPEPPARSGATSVVLPDLGESVAEARVTRWLKQADDPVDVDDPLVEMTTDENAIEIPSPVAGILLEVTADEGAIVPVGAELAVIGESEAEDSALPWEPPETGDSRAEAQRADAVETDEEAQRSPEETEFLRQLREAFDDLDEPRDDRIKKIQGRRFVRDYIRFRSDQMEDREDGPNAGQDTKEA